MVVDLPAAYVGLRQASARAARNDATRVPGRNKVALESEWRVTMAVALRQLPPGACLTVRDSDGREWYVGPAAQPRAARFREAA